MNTNNLSTRDYIDRAKKAKSASEQIKELSLLTSEDKFSAGANGWLGYSGCLNPVEKAAYSENIDLLITELTSILQSKPESKELLNNLVLDYGNRARKLVHKYEAETDERETQFLYFMRIRTILGLTQSDGSFL